MNNFGGKHSTKRLEKNKQCPKCKKKGVYYLGSSVAHGNPFTPAADTEVDHYYECPHCQHEWTEYA